MSIADVLTEQQLVEQEYDRVVREDIELFRSQAALRTAGQMTDDELRPQRLRRGVYSQRQPDVHMIRTKVPGGLLTSEQMRQMGRVADEFAGGKGHLTTRQNIQYHFVPLPKVADLLHMLADVRLTTREACYNTVRNVTACPLAGIHPEEPFDVQPYARRVAFAFLHKELTDSLPRKFKIAFAGCPEDCIATAINDVGLRAMIRDGVKGFRMTVAGGLGPLPTESKVLHEFIPADDLVRRIEAVIRVFNVHGNRKNKNKARLKFVLRERGFEWLRDTIEEQYQGHLNWHPASKFTASISGGVEQRNFLNSKASAVWNPIYSANLGYQLFEQTGLSIYANRSINSSIFDHQISQNTSVGVGVQQRLLGKLHVNLGFGFNKVDYQSTATSNLSTSRSDESTSYTAGVSLPFLKHCSFSTFYQYSQNTSSQNGFSYDSSQVGASLFWAF